MKRFIFTAIVLLVFTQYQLANGETLRARDMSTEQWQQLSQGKQIYTVEFREGDEIPVSFSSEGDLLESTQVGLSYVKVKRNFWLKLQQDDVAISLDGQRFKKLSDVVTGAFMADAGATPPGVPVNAIRLLLRASLK